MVGDILYCPDNGRAACGIIQTVVGWHVVLSRQWQGDMSYCPNNGREACCIVQTMAGWPVVIYIQWQGRLLYCPGSCGLPCCFFSQWWGDMLYNFGVQTLAGWYFVRSRQWQTVAGWHVVLSRQWQGNMPYYTYDVRVLYCKVKTMQIDQQHFTFICLIVAGIDKTFSENKYF